MRIDVSSNINEVLGWTARLHPQFKFAVALAMTNTVKAIRDAMPQEVNAAFEGGAVPFTKAGFYSQGARKDKLEATVGAKDKQAAYLRFQVSGGARQPTRKALRLPSVVHLDAYGNVPSGLIRQLVARAKAGKRATKRQSARFGVSQALDLFYGEPGDGRPAGIYKRVVISATRHQLVPIIVFPKRPAQYRPRFDFYGIANRIVQRQFPRLLNEAWARALATAR